MARHDDPTRTALLDAAHSVLADEGPSALTVRRIATAAGVSTMNVYSRFGGKDGVVDELWSDGFHRLRDAMAAVEPRDDAVAELLRCTLAYRGFALANPTYYAVMFQGVVPDFEPSDASKDVAAGVFLLLVERVQRAMDAGRIAPRDPLEAAAAVWATCHGLVSLELAGAAPVAVDWAFIFDVTLGALVRGLAVDPRGG